MLSVPTLECIFHAVLVAKKLVLMHGKFGEALHTVFPPFGMALRDKKHFPASASGTQYVSVPRRYVCVCVCECVCVL